VDHADDALIDSEAVVFRDDGRSDFVALLTKRGWAEALLIAFDLLRHDGDDLYQRPPDSSRSWCVLDHGSG
jgi:ATP-dependent DNA ligase